MTASMTAFSRLHGDYPAGRLTWEIRSVNHRYLDIHLKLPEDLRAVETGCRERITATLGRGRIDAALRFEPGLASARDLTLNPEALSALGRALDKVRETLHKTAKPDPCEVLRWPGVLEQAETDFESLIAEALALLDGALEQLGDARRREGSRLESLIRERVDGARAIVNDLRAQLPQIEQDLKTRWTRRLTELGDEVDPARIAQEQAMLLTRADVSEELDRLETHLGEVERVLGKKQPAGRRLDFLMQELNREANTLGSKSSDLRNTNAAVELKVLIDQMREQVQNLE